MRPMERAGSAVHQAPAGPAIAAARDATHPGGKTGARTSASVPRSIFSLNHLGPRLALMGRILEFFSTRSLIGPVTNFVASLAFRNVLSVGHRFFLGDGALRVIGEMMNREENRERCK